MSAAPQAQPVAEERAPAAAQAAPIGPAAGQQPAARAASAHVALETALRVISRARPPGDLTAYERCLPQLLDALAWTGETRHLVDALPHVDAIENLDTFRAVLARLGYESEVAALSPATCPADRFPMVCELDGALRVVLAREASGALLVAGAAAEEGGAPAAPTRAPAPTGQVTACRVWTAEPSAAPAESGSWIMDRLGALGDPMRGALWLTLLINLFAVATPLYSMAVYNLVIPSASYDTLAFIAAIALLALAVEDFFRRLRVEVVANLGVRLHAEIMRSGVAKVLALPISLIEQVSTTSQLAQLRRFENVLGAFHGPAVTALLDLPFALLLLAVVAALGGPLVFIPIALAIAFAAAAAATAPMVEHAEARSARARREAHELLRETVVGARAIRAAGVERIWMQRVADTLAGEAAASARGEVSQQLAGHFAQLLLALGAAAMLAMGAVLAIEGALSVGALIAVMMLSWRATAPIQTLYLSLAQLKGVRQDMEMIDKLMTFKDERREGQAARIYRRFDGAVRLDGVSFRYPNATEFSLRNVSLAVRPGERVGVVGSTGSGRSTLLRVALGLHQPTVGAVFVDGLPLRQLDVGEVRASAAYAPQRPEFFYGTIAQNMRLARPDVADGEIEEILETLDAPLYPEIFPEALETRLTNATREALGPVTLQKLNIARALVSRRPILILDDPTATLDAAAQAALARVLDRRRGETAALIATNNRALLESCDRILVLSAGRPVAYGPAEEILKRAS